MQSKVIFDVLNCSCSSKLTLTPLTRRTTFSTFIALEDEFGSQNILCVESCKSLVLVPLVDCRWHYFQTKNFKKQKKLHFPQNDEDFELT